MSDMENLSGPEGIAIVGMAGRFPGARNLEHFWRNLRDGIESITIFSDDELRAAGVPPAMLNDPNYVKAGAVLDDIDRFDAEFFGFSPREAEIMSPHQRLFLECSWEALERAGYDSERDKSEIGVYAGVNLSTYLFNLYSNPEVVNSVGAFRVLIGNDKDFLPTWVSYKLNLKGPSVNVQTGCSTSLVAVHLACQSLLNYQCDMALAGGISVDIPQKSGYLYEAGSVSSPDGHCRSFDASAQGSVPGNAVGVVLLKRLEEALAHGDTIHAVIKGSAVNNDGALRIGYTAPSVQGQAKVIATALAVAAIEPETVSYVEAHGSATSIGDPIEIAALTRAFRASTRRKQRVAIGSVKTNIGHTGVASGIAGLIKTVLALEHRQIPASLHFKQPNSQIDFDHSPFYVNTELVDWETNGTPRRAGVSSFGIGGTNAHLILEEASAPKPSGPSRPWQLLLLSGRSSAALETMTDNLAAHLKQHPQQSLADVAFTLQTGRKRFNHRRMLVCQRVEDAVRLMETKSAQGVLTGKRGPMDRPVAFMFSGLGDHYVNMARGLYQSEVKFREQVESCCQLLKPHLGLDLQDVLYPSGAEEAGEEVTEQTSAAAPGRQGVDLRKMLSAREPHRSEAARRLSQTSLAQPALFVIEYALAQLWMHWGVQPQAMIGYSIGEYVAACLAGVLSLEDALYVVAKRAQMIQSLTDGSMLAISLSEEESRTLLDENLSIAGINGPSLTVVAGPTQAVTALEEKLQLRSIACRRLDTSHAFHSKMMRPIEHAFIRLMRGVKLRPPRIPYVSNVTGTWITSAEATNPDYWARHLCGAVRFLDGVQTLYQRSEPVLLEVGPGQMLSSLVIQQVGSAGAAKPVALPSVRSCYHRQSDLAVILNTLGQLWLEGVEIEWSNFCAHEQRHRLQLPTYPFERHSYWIELRPIKSSAVRSPTIWPAPFSTSGTSQIFISSTTQPSRSDAEKHEAIPGNLPGRNVTQRLHSRPRLNSPYVPPASPMEQTIAEIWRNLMGIAEIGIHDNFFQLGGNSLLGIQLTSQLRQKFQLEVPVRVLFEAPTVAELALTIEDILLTEIEGMNEGDASSQT